MHLFMHLREQGRTPRGEAGWARKTSPAAPGGARGQGDPVGLVQGTHRCQGPPSGVDARAAGGLVQPARVNALETTVVGRSLAKRETRSLSADVSVRGLLFSS